VLENHPEVVRFAHENVILQDQLKEYVRVLEESNAGTLYLKVVELEDSAKELGETVARLFNENCHLKEDLAAPKPESEEIITKLHQLKVFLFFSPESNCLDFLFVSRCFLFVLGPM